MRKRRLVGVGQRALFCWRSSEAFLMVVLLAFFRM